jgi:hypothetical protein
VDIARPGVGTTSLTERHGIKSDPGISSHFLIFFLAKQKEKTKKT